MMEEISIMVAYDAHVFSQLHDEDFLTSLVAISKPRSMVGGASHTTLGLFFLFGCDSWTPLATEKNFLIVKIEVLLLALCSGYKMSIGF